MLRFRVVFDDLTHCLVVCEDVISADKMATEKHKKSRLAIIAEPLEEISVGALEYGFDPTLIPGA